RIAETAMRRWPDDARFYVMRSEANRLETRLPDAEADLRAAVAHASSPHDQARDLASLAHLLQQKEWNPPRLKDAEQAARQALERDPNNLEAHYWLGRALDLQDRSEEAEREYEIDRKS